MLNTIIKICFNIFYFYLKQIQLRPSKFNMFDTDMLHQGISCI